VIGQSYFMKAKIFFLNRMQKKFRLKILYRYREILKNELISLSYDVNDHVYSKPKCV